MFIKNRNQYLISENLKQARQYLTKKSISLDLPEFTHIVNSLKDTPNLIDTFTRMVFTDGSDLNTEMGKFNQISNWIKSNRNILNQLPKNIIQYKSLEELSDDITQLEQDRKIHKFIKSLYRSMRDEVSKLGSEDREEFDDLAISFMNLSDSEKSQFTPMRYFSQNNVSIREFMDSLDKFVNGQDVNDNKKKVYNYIKNNTDKLNIPYNEDNVLVIQTNDGESVCELGSQRWCIVYAPNSYQNQYFGEDSMNTQYIIYNFNLPSSSRYSMFGVTINVEGSVISGGSQDKSNSFINLDKIYELTGIPEGTLRSVYEEEYKKLKEDISTIDKNSTFEEIREIRELSLKLNKGILTESPTIVWIDYYISSKLSDSEKLDDNTDEYRNKLNIIIEDITSKCKTLGISSKSMISELQNKYLKSLVNSYNLLELESIDDLISNISSLLKESEDRSVSNSMILNVLNEWIVDNTKDRDASFIISILNKIISGVDNKDVSFSIYTYIHKNKDLFKLIIDEIGNSIESISHHLNENLPLLKVIKIDFSEIIKDRNWISPSSLNEFIIVYYKYVFGIMESHYTYNSYKYLSDTNDGYVRVKSDIIPPIMITLDSINRFKSELKSIDENLLNYDGYNSKSMRWGESLDGLYSDLIGEYLVVENRSSIEEIRDCFRLFKDSIIEKEPLYLNNNIIQLMSSFESNIDDVYDFVLEYIDDFEIEDVFSTDYIDDIYRITKDDIFNMGGLFIKIIESDYIHDIDDFSRDIVMYGAGLHDEEYMNIFRKGIGLKYHEEFKVWYMETDYNTLGDYFDTPYDFEDNYDQFYDYSTYGLDFNDYFDYIDIRNLYQISSYIKDISESDIDLSILTKYKNDGKWVGYKESMEYYREDSELRKLREDIMNIIDDGGDDDIISDIILNAYNRAYSYAREREYFNDQISVIGYDILTQWESEKSFGNSFLMWDNNNNIMVIPDLNKLFDYEYSYIAVLSEYVSLDNIDIDYIIDAYLNINNKFDWATDDGYTYMDDNNYIDFNDELRHLLGEDDIYYESIDTILKLSEYMKIQS